MRTLDRRRFLCHNINMKTCSECKQELSLDSFYKRTSGKPETRCKKCFVAAQALSISRRQEGNSARGAELRGTGASKVCRACKDTKPYSEFNLAKKNHDGHAYNCKACSRPYAKKYYENNRERLKDSQSASLQESIKRKRDYLIGHYRGNPCVDCGETDILVLQSDHQRDKAHEIARLVNSGHSLQTLVDELSKCLTRCSNCHQRVTAKSFGFWRLEYV